MLKIELQFHYPIPFRFPPPAPLKRHLVPRVFLLIRTRFPVAARGSWHVTTLFFHKPFHLRQSPGAHVVDDRYVGAVAIVPIEGIDFVRNQR
ncbi:uncharacterized protein LAJ45_02683 [Morchella importuna]|uniref:uncharacterized protein n=1 Tax=Morchella importuna TaxID=1174673 RepID=UPI001E8ED2DA|nr:uncharacterized protein LAJ45_02683 [Morchella importuna]KAH8153096.1 hypothetical protein LAJ45_02683 [Morchella importuna]